MRVVLKLVWTLLNVECRIRRVSPISGRLGDPTFSLRSLLVLTAMLNAVGVQSKGPTEKYAIEARTSVSQDLGDASVTLRSDGEPAILTVLQALRTRVGRRESIEKVVLRAAPVHFKQNVGTGERSIRTIGAQMHSCCSCTGKLV